MRQFDDISYWASDELTHLDNALARDWRQKRGSKAAECQRHQAQGIMGERVRMPEIRI
jgi:hypothetical protein